MSRSRLVFTNGKLILTDIARQDAIVDLSFSRLKEAAPAITKANDYFKGLKARS